MKDRLQFIHHNEVFPTREAAIKYVKDLQIDSRPSLFAEPIVLKYESGDEEKGPNVILAIGSHGIGVYNEEYKRTLNRTFFIDITSEQEKIDDLYDKLEKAIRSLTLIPLESDTIKTFAEKTENGTIINSDVKTAESMIFSGIEKTNTIEVVDGEGLYHYVDLIYTDDGVLKFQVNDVIKDYSIPVVTEGEYIYEGDDAETIVLTMNDGSTVKIPVGKLINEWTVMPEDANNTPIVLKREEVSAETCPHGVEVWQDLLSADIRLHEGDGNIIFKADGGKTLFATVGLDYNEIENKLVFKWSENGSVNTKDILLNSVKIIEYIKYDAATEEIVIGYKTSQASEIIEVRIPVGNLITEWQVVDAGHNVILRRERSVSGADIVYADVRIATNDIAPNNIIETVGDNHALYVRGEADNIKFDDSNVDAELKRLNSEDVRIEGKLDGEIERATASENVLTDKIGTGFTADPHENVTFKFGKLNDTLNETISDLNDEINNREAVDDELAANIAAETTRATEAENAIATDLSVEVSRAKAAENGLNEAINAEVTRAENAENVLTNKIGSGFTADPHENVTAKFNELSDGLATTKNNLTNEIARAQVAENDIASDLSDEVANRIAGDNALSGAVSNEIARSTEADQVLTDKIGSGFTADPHENVTVKFEGLDAKVTGIDTRVSANTEDIVTINGKINEISGTTAGKVSSVTAKDASVIVDNTDANNPEVQVNLKPLESNIIELDNGIYATVDLSYDELANKLTFTTTNGSKEISLLSVSIIKSMTYDPATESIIIVYTVNGEDKTLSVDVSALITEWETSNHDHTVTLTKTRDTGSGKDKLSADLNISNDPDNMIEIVGGEYIKVSNASITAISADIASEVTRATAAEGELSDKIGTGFTVANNITKKIEEIEEEIAQGGGSVDAEVARAMAAEANLQAQITAEATERTSADTALNEAIMAEANRAEGVEDTINATIGTGFTTDSHENVTAKFNKLESDLNNTTSGLTDEVTRATGVEADLQTQITAEATERASGYTELNNAIVAEANRANGVEATINATIGTGFTDNPYANVTFKFDTLTNKVNGIDERVSGNTDDIATVVQKVNELSAETTNDIASVAAKDRSIVVDNTDAKNPKVGVALRNVENNIISIGEGVYATVDLTYNELANKLTFTTTNGSKEISLTSISVIDRIWYDSTNEEIVIEYKVGSETEVIRVPVRDMIDEWDINNEGHSVLMTRVKSVSGTDIVYSDVKISDEADNILTKNNSGYLKVSNAPIALLDTAIQNEVTRATNAESAIDTKVDTVSGQVVDNASSIAALSGEVSANITKINTISGNVENFATGLTNEAATRESQIGALTQSALTLSSNTIVISGDVENIKTQYATDVTKLKNDVGSLSGDVITISTGLTILDDKVDNIFSNLNVSEDSDIVSHSIILTKVTDGDTVKVRGDVRLHPNHDTFVNLLKQNPDDGTLYVSKADVTSVSLHPENNALFLTEEGIGLKLNGISETINSDNNVKFKVINNGGVKEIKCDVELFECGDY